jgi:lipid II:glycine glycyltransferase (peptidoglycan interpeptide bridge formation enzyme)
MTDQTGLPLQVGDWDKALIQQGGHLLQSWRWGTFKAEFGWSVKRVSVTSHLGIAVAQILFQHRGPVSAGYVPRGPAIPDGDTSLAEALMRNIDDISRRERAIYTLIEPERALPFSGTFKEHGFVLGPENIQPERTVKVPLIEDDALLAQMRQNNRYMIRLAIRRGVQVHRVGGRYSIEDFYKLLSETSDRNEFAIHSQDYYRRFLEIFGDDALCIFAEHDGNLAAAVIAVRFGREGIYMYGASSSHHRAHGAAFLLQFEAMKWARAAGCERYDLWGIPAVDPESLTDTGDTVARTKGSDWRGLYRFKAGFGGEIVDYPPVLERRYNTIGAVLARRLARRTRGDT